jgi:hypothetical protein
LLVVAAVGFGAEANHRQVLERVRAGLPPLFEMVSPMPYTALQQMFDEAHPWGTHTYEKGLYLEDFTNAAIDVIVERRRPRCRRGRRCPTRWRPERSTDLGVAGGGGRPHGPRVPARVRCLAG